VSTKNNVAICYIVSNRTMFFGRPTNEEHSFCIQGGASLSKFASSCSIFTYCFIVFVFTGTSSSRSAAAYTRYILFMCSFQKYSAYLPD